MSDDWHFIRNPAVGCRESDLAMSALSYCILTKTSRRAWGPFPHQGEAFVLFLYDATPASCTIELSGLR
jgi:hypothetical protein